MKTVTKGILYSEMLVRSLESSLKHAFNQPYVRLTRQPHNPGAAFPVQIENSPRNARDDDGLEWGVVEILTPNGHATTFCFSFVATFALAPTHKYSLQHAGLTVFQEMIGEPAPLFRAEWDQLDASSGTSDHAQPHWHFVQRPERIEDIVRTLLAPPGQFSPKQKSEFFSGLADCGKFHFAMTSLWEKGQTTAHKRLFDSDDFPKWFGSLTKYVAGQIAYLLSRMPPAAISKTRPFVPLEHRAE